MVDRPDVEAPRGVEPTGTNSRTATPHNHPMRGGKSKHHSDDRETPCTSHGSFLQSRPLSGPQPTTQTPAGTRASVARGMVNRRFAAAMAQGRRPDPFRTRKLRPGTAMVLHPEGCGRVARRRTQTSQGGDTTACPLPFSHTRTQPQTRPSHTGHARRIPYPDTHDPGTPGSKTARTTRSKIAHVRCSTCLLRAFFLVFKRQRLFFGNLNRLLNLCSESL
jgi:hypothetical protein